MSKIYIKFNRDDKKPEGKPCNEKLSLYLHVGASSKNTYSIATIHLTTDELTKNETEFLLEIMLNQSDTIRRKVVYNKRLKEFRQFSKV